ncbi:hypothetical protein [Schauerella aestuarii]|uniref:hypothetical protein n=1 Tax=Schauerella aestuarii TaxID=2511204 RepID=UPI00136D6CFE|nr:hypothetical protein [Achromobacter aestuarii]MYZ41908.1 hypothetical protein [Achromobacter aestuarii]
MTAPRNVTHRDPDPLWGWQRPGCHGKKALAFFIDDLDRILKPNVDGIVRSGGIDVEDAEVRLATMQGEVDTLIARYGEVGVAPEIFGQAHVTLKVGTDRSGIQHTVPVFSPALKQALMAML